MRVSLALPTSVEGEPLGGDDIGLIAEAAERGGFYSVHVADHPFPGREWLSSGGHHSPDPFVTLAVAGARTSRLRLMTNLLVLPYRHPALAAKSMSSLDRASGGRTVFGVGVGYEAREFEGLGVAFSDRNDLFDHALKRIYDIWSGSAQSTNVSEPGPLQAPRPPVWIGGNSRLAMRRAVDAGDGWMPMANPSTLAARRRTSVIETVNDLRLRVDEMRHYVDEVRREDPPVLSFTTFAPMPEELDDRGVAAVLDEAHALSKVGVSHLRIEMTRRSRAQVLDAIEEFSLKVLPEIDALPVNSLA